jgi:hypothetical protein
MRKWEEVRENREKKALYNNRQACINKVRRVREKETKEKGGKRLSRYIEDVIELNPRRVRHRVHD